MKKLIISSIIALCATYVAAQTPSYIFFNNFQNVVNPAAVGTTEKHNITLNLRNQWGQSSHSDNPQQQTLNTTHRLSHRIGLGASVVSEKVFIQRQTAFFADFSYQLPLSPSSELYLGLKAGGNLFNIDSSKLKTYNPSFDPYLQGVSGRFQPNMGVGVYYVWNNFFAGLAAPNLFASDKTKISNEVVTSVSERVNFYLQAGYSWGITPDITLRPSLQAYINQDSNYQVDATATVLYTNCLEGGLGYHSQQNINAYALFKIPDWHFAIGYGFETTFNSNISSSLRNIHEVLIKFYW